MKIKNIYFTLLTIFSLSLLFIPNNVVKAEFRAGPVSGNIDIVCGSSGCGSDSNKLQLVGYVGNVGISVYSRPFNFIRSDNGAALVQYDSIPNGSSLTFSPYGNAWGNWWVSGGGYDTPDMGTGEHLIPEARTRDGNGRINVYAPNTRNPIAIEGFGAVTCNGWVCTANQEGPATIKVTFPQGAVGSTSAPKYSNESSICSNTQTQCSNTRSGSGQITGEIQCDYWGNCRTVIPGTLPICPEESESWDVIGCYCPNGDRFEWNQAGQGSFRTGQGTTVTNKRCVSQGQQQQVCNNVQVPGDNDCGQDQENIFYGDQSTTINFTVVRSNTAPTVNYTNTTDISYNTAKANWIYNDSENDAQVKSHIQVSTDSGFNNIVFNASQNTVSTSFNISGLIPGTTYYPRVRSQDSMGAWSNWSNGPAFTTIANNPPSLSDFSCGVSTLTTTPDKYTKANVNWNYTGSDQDELLLTIRYKKISESIWSQNIFGATNSGNLDQGGLEPGNKYQFQINLTDKYNSHITNQIKDCGTVAIDSYPAPQISFTLSNGNKTSTVQKGGTLTIGQSDGVLASWNIQDSFGLIDNSCRITNTTISGGVDAQIFNQTGLGFSITDLPGQNIPQAPQDLSYNVNLRCDGKPANPIVEVNENITLNIVSTPTVSCQVDKKSVDINNPTVTLTADIGNVMDYYDFKIGKNIGEAPVSSGRSYSIVNNQSTLTENLDYSSNTFGRYRPWVEITSKSGKTVLKNCGIITNFGDTKIKEINP